MKRVAWFLAGAALFGCDDPNKPISLPCDITLSDCQKAVFAATADTRGDRRATIPPIRVISRAQLRDELTASLMEDASPTPEQIAAQKAYAAVQKAYALFGVLPADAGAADEAQVDDLAEGIAAYYSPRDKAITIVDDSAQSPEDGTYTLSHEFVHALQHERGDLGRPETATSTDGYSAFDCLIEGEAVWLSNETMAVIGGATLRHRDIEPYFDTMTDAVMAQIGESAAPLYRAGEILSYPLGGRGVAHAWQAADLSGIEALHVDGQEPSRTTFWLRDEEPPRADVRCDLPTPPAGYELLERDRWGLVGLVALAASLGEEPSLAFAETWRDDLVGAYASEDRTQSAVVLRVRMASEADAMELQNQLEMVAPLANTPALTITREGDEVLAIGATDPELDVAELALCAAPMERRLRDRSLAAWSRRRMPFVP